MNKMTASSSPSASTTANENTNSESAVNGDKNLDSSASENESKDPAWMKKKKAGKKLDPIEIEEFYNHKFIEEHKKLISDTNFEGIPSEA